VNAGPRPLAGRFDAAGWGLILILFGALALPRGVAEFTLVAGTGAAMLGLNALRVMSGVPVAWFGIILGAVALVAGVGAIVGVTVPAVALLFILLGLGTIIGAVVRSR
jgi:hypothetical protein